MIYADYSQYIDTFGGDVIDEAAFLKLSRLASAFLDDITMGNIDDRWSTDEKVVMACCAVTEELHRQADGRGEVASETNHSVSRTYVTSGKSNERRLYDAAALFLSGTGLLYRGIG